MNDVEVRCPECKCFLAYFFHVRPMHSMRVRCPRCMRHILIELRVETVTATAYETIAQMAIKAYTSN